MPDERSSKLCYLLCFCNPTTKVTHYYSRTCRFGDGNGPTSSTKEKKPRREAAGLQRWESSQKQWASS